MMNTGKLKGMTVFITGASRGIGKAIALKVAKDGANVVIAAKTAEPHPKLPGTIFTAAKEVEDAGGKALPCIVDVRNEEQVKQAVEKAVAKFGGIDILVNNASAISLSPTLSTEMKKFDLMQNINTRGTFLVSKTCLPYLKKGKNPHILNLSPPINLNPFWFENHLAYTISKYGMSFCILGMHREFKEDGIAVNALWPKTAIATAAIEMLAGSSASHSSRKPEIVADAAYAILIRDSKAVTGNFFIDEDILREEGVTNFKQYAVKPENDGNFLPDFFLDSGISTIENKILSLPKAEPKPEPKAETKAEPKAETKAEPKAEPKAETKAEPKAEPKAETEAEPKSEPKAEPSAPDYDKQIEELFKSIRAQLSEDLVKKVQAVYQFNVKGTENTHWHLDLKNGSGSCGKGKPSTPPDATLTMDAKDFFNLFSGKLKPVSAFMTGKLQISGKVQDAMKLEKLMNSLKSKL